jgi:hypothetical protein
MKFQRFARLAMAALAPLALALVLGAQSSQPSASPLTTPPDLWGAGGEETCEPGTCDDDFKKWMQVESQQELLGGGIPDICLIFQLNQAVSGVNAPAPDGGQPVNAPAPITNIRREPVAAGNCTSKCARGGGTFSAGDLGGQSVDFEPAESELNCPGTGCSATRRLVCSGSGKEN